MKNKWYKSNLTKTLLIVAEHICAALVIASVLSVFAYPAFVEEMLAGRIADHYEESLVFEESMKQYSAQAVEHTTLGEIFETEGKFDPDKIVDIEEYYDEHTVSGKNNSGLAYRMEELLNWDAYYDEYDNQDQVIIICEKEDGTYQYYRYGEFANLIHSGKLKLNGYLNDESNDSGEILDYMYEMGDSGRNFLQVQDEKGKTLYVNCWSYDGAYLYEAYKPDGADSILDIVNENPEWNGRLSEAFDMIGMVIDDLTSEYGFYCMNTEGLEEGDTNFYYIYVDKAAKKVSTNYAAFGDYKKVNDAINELKTYGKYVVVEPTLDGFECNIQGADAEAWREALQYHINHENDFIFAAAVDTSYPIQDVFYTDAQNYEQYGNIVRPLIVMGIISVIVMIIGLVWLTIIAGRNDRDDELHLNRFDQWKTENAAGFITVLCLGVAVLGAVLASECGAFDMMYYRTESSLSYGMTTACIAAVTAIEVVAFAFFLTGYLSLVRRIKAHTLWKNSVLGKIISLIRYTFQNIHSVWKVLIVFGAFVAVHWLAMAGAYSGYEIFIIGMVLVEAAAAVGLILYAIGKEQIKRGIQNIAEGDVDYKIPTEKMLPEHKVIADSVNSIGAGLDAAVEKSMKSERMKTDLITNVSHDIKTPLTSIINYVDLLKKENFEDPKIQRYLEILDQKSQRLKVLTEDVVEASKVSSGNISLEFMKLNFVEMIQQTSGEFEEKFQKRGLKEILTLPEEEVVIRVDGRRTWRVLENIYNNAAKYALEGSRVYADLKVEGKNAVFTLKNISEQPLNISADELTERFIRGDVSRSTEGSGLGLSIAQNLTQLQGGQFEIYLDGDLFKVTIMFPVA